MTMGTSALSNRTMSAFPCSIATSLALESMFEGVQPPYDPLREIPQRIEVSDYSVCWINLMTLFRNIIGALPPKEEAGVMAGEVSDVLQFEVDLIRQLINQATQGQTKAVFYASNYKKLEQKHPHAKLRTPQTEKQKQYKNLMELTLDDYFKQQPKGGDSRLFDLHLKPKPGEDKKCLILTHFAYDLLSEGEFEELDLIESHTGVLKKRSMWHTKLLNGKDLMIPLNACTLQVFGDSHTFSPQPMKLREQVVELSKKFRWHGATTKDRLIFSFNAMNDKFAAMVLKDMLSEY